MFAYKRKARYHETDQMGVVHHSNYVKWMEEARIEYMDAMGVSFKAVEKSGVISPIVGVSLEYKRPVAFDDEVEVRVFVKKYNGTVLELGYEFFDLTTGEVCTEASSRNCFVKDGRVASLKKAVPELDEKLRAELAKQ